MLSTRSNRLELLDRLSGSVSDRELAGNLRDIRRANRFLGGTRAVGETLQPVLRGLAERRTGPVSILDLATGSADIPSALIARAKCQGIELRIVATDVQPEILASAALLDMAGLTLEHADARSLPYSDDAFDIVTLALALHHFEPADAVTVLREMRRAGRHALVVSDLARSRPGYVGAWLFGHVLTRNRLTRHDAPLSVQRAYTPAEALELARAAGWRNARVRSVFPFRFVLIGRP